MTGLQALFGSLPSVFVVAAFYRRVRRAPPMHLDELRNFSRGLSRLVYLQLYLVFGAVLLANMPVWPIAELRAILGFGIAALLMIRVLAAWIGLSLSHAGSGPRGDGPLLKRYLRP